MTIIYRKLRTISGLIIRSFFFPLNFILFTLIILISKIKLIRVGKIKSDWLGEFVIRSEIYVHEKKRFYSNSLDFLIINKYISNKFFYKKLKSKIRVYPTIFLDTLYLIDFFSKYFPSLDKHKAFRNDQQRDTLRVLDKEPVFFDISVKEKDKGEQILKNIIKKDFKGIVLFCVRNKDYNHKYFNDRDWRYLNYRDYSFEDFLPAAEFLANKNYIVLRMGKFNSSKLNFHNKNIIDYSTSSWRSDFMDYYLGYKSSFCISTQTGMDCFARLFRKPFGTIVNPIEDIFYFQKNWNHIFGFINEIDKDKILKLDDVISNKLHLLSTLETIDESKYRLIKNKKDEILDLVEEVCNSHEKQNNIKNEDRKLEKLFWNKFLKNKLTKKKITQSGMDDQLEINANICLKFLEKNKHLF